MAESTHMRSRAPGNRRCGLPCSSCTAARQGRAAPARRAAARCPPHCMLFSPQGVLAKVASITSRMQSQIIYFFAQDGLSVPGQKLEPRQALAEHALPNNRVTGQQHTAQKGAGQHSTHTCRQSRNLQPCAYLSKDSEPPLQQVYSRRPPPASTDGGRAPTPADGTAQRTKPHQQFLEQCIARGTMHGTGNSA